MNRQITSPETEKEFSSDASTDTDEEPSDEIYDIDVDDEDKDITSDDAPSDDDDVFTESCLYKFVEQPDSDDEEFHDEPIFDDDDKEIDNDNDKVAPEDRITKPILYNYERVRLLCARTKLLALGSKPMIKNSEHLPSKRIAELEIQDNVIPLYIKRPLPNGKYELWDIKELKH